MPTESYTRLKNKMDKAAMISFFLSFATANNIVEYQQKWTPPAFCNDIGCPQYVSVRNYTVEDRIVEERKYVKTSWVSTTMKDLDFRTSQSAMFMKLFSYISGANEKGTKIAMTAPVKTRIKPGQGMACESNFTMSFFVSPDQEPAPKPTDKSVRIDEVDSVTYYVVHFGGFARNFTTWARHAIQLGEDLEKMKLTFEKDHYYVCGYDSPFKIFNRHNEVWFLKK